MFLFYPNINTYLVAFPNFSHTHVQHGTSAVDIAKQYRDYFPKESYEYLTFQSLISFHFISFHLKDLQLVSQYLFIIILQDY